ncbi:Crp/Fnr family transcriptional regulator [Enterovirga rhinocerotis]|uniref:CRP-like cAMP-binding protein n=1 Tax=Enterovirga rhinocerotis TaxID=1339210 RepID=A0A4R7C7P2_9HYPH|nr:Crp/Fnr family transcriptional regulator [Enterovirga rhinocerotis]TDR94193.1 CRP-like cAMP-binding protein [Enterovirga rhinocerotis]
MPGALFKRIERHGALSEHERRALLDAASRRREIPAKHELVAEGNVSSESTLIVEGFALRQKTLEDGRRQITAIHVPGDFADLHSFLLKKLDDGVETLTACKVVMFPHENLKKLSDDFPHLTRVLWFMTLVDAAIHRAWIMGMGALSAPERLAHLFCELKDRLTQVGLAQADRFRLPLTQSELGDVLGLSAVHVNRSFQQLRMDGIVQTDKRDIIVSDWDELRRFADYNPDYLHLNQTVERD